MLAYNIYAYNQGAPAVPINLKGILVGNGCIGSEAGVCGSSLYGDYLTLAQFHGHAFLSDKAFEAANAACGDYSAESPACRVAVAAANDEVGSNFDVYDLYSDMWGQCNYGNRLRKLGRRVAPTSALGRLLERQAARLGDNNCTSDDDLTAYLNLPAVQAALHVTPKTWEECGGIVYDSEMKDERTVIYPTLIEKAQIQVVIFNGQVRARASVCVCSMPWAVCARACAVWAAADGGGKTLSHNSPPSHPPIPRRPHTHHTRAPTRPPRRPTLACPSQTTSGGRAAWATPRRLAGPRGRPATAATGAMCVWCAPPSASSPHARSPQRPLARTTPPPPQVTTYKTPGAGSFTFATVRGSGHSASGAARASCCGAGTVHARPQSTLAHRLSPPSLPMSCSGAPDAAHVRLRPGPRCDSGHGPGRQEERAVGRQMVGHQALFVSTLLGCTSAVRTSWRDSNG